MKPNHLEKEFEFRGFVKNLKTHDLYDYISSNRLIKGNRWIYPKKYTNNVKIKRKRPSLNSAQDDWDQYLIDGYTKILRHVTET